MDKLPSIWISVVWTAAIEVLTLLSAIPGILADIFGFSGASSASYEFAVTSMKVTGTLMGITALHTLTAATLEVRAAPRTPLP